MTVRTETRMTATIAVAVAGLVLFVLFGVLAEVPWSGLRHLDAAAPAAGHAAALRGAALRALAKIVTDLGSPLAVNVVALVAAAWLAWRRQWWPVVAIAVARWGELATETLAKVVVDRPRPDLRPLLTSASDSSFPSGHAAGSAAVYGTVAVLVALRLGRQWPIVAASLFAVLVGASRVVLGVHYPTDVLAGLSLGAAWVAAAVVVVSFGDRKSEPEVT